MNIYNIDNLKLHSIIQVSSEAPEGEHIYYNGTCPHYELICTLSGHNIVTFQNIVTHDRAGVVRFLPRRIPDNTYRVDFVETSDCIDIFFDTESPLPSTILSKDFSDTPAIRRLFVSIYRTWSEKKPGYYNQCISFFYAILSELEKAQSLNSPRLHRTKIEKATEYIHGHYCDPDFDYPHLAELCGVSYTYFKKLFTGIYRTTPHAYIRTLQLQKACELLSTNRFSISRVAEQCGFANIYYFSKVFKDEMQMTPSEYAKAQKSPD